MDSVEEESAVEIRNSESDDDDSKHLLPIFKAYKRRFYILLVYSAFSLLQGAVWNTWGPVSDTASKVYEWNTATIALLTNWGPILFVIAFIPMVNIILRFGLRAAVLHCTLFMAIGTGVRCIPSNNTIKTVTSHFCGILVGYCGTLCMIAVPSISATWFLPNERTKATGFIATVGQNLATGVSFIVPKLMVPDYNVSFENGTSDYYEKMGEMRQGLANFLYLEFGVCLAVFIMVFFYFPSKPPTPPSSSATVERIEFKLGAAQLLKSCSFWIVLISYALPFGLQNAFVGIMNEILLPHGISQATSDWIGTFSSLAGVPGALFFSAITDCNKKMLKPLLVVGVLVSGISYGAFALLCIGVIPVKAEYVYIAMMSGGFFCNAVTPLIYEFACEISYPVSEIVTTGLLTASNNFFGFVLLALLMIKQLGMTWVAIALGASFLVMVPFLIALRADYRRTGVDTDEVDVQENKIEPINT